jgi:hypothetical protein
MHHYLFGAFVAFFMMWKVMMTVFVPLTGQKTTSAIQIPTEKGEVTLRNKPLLTVKSYQHSTNTDAGGPPLISCL